MKQGIHNGLKENAMDLSMFTLIIVTFLLANCNIQFSARANMIPKNKNYGSFKLNQEWWVLSLGHCISCFTMKQ